MSPGNGPQRRRGVRASRAKLVHALTEAGFRTQAALAEHIADIEDLETPPKDVINRVFRELPVDPTTIERVARALGVDAHTLYKSADEEDPVGVDVESPQPPNKAWIIIVAATVVLAIAFAIGFRLDAPASIDDVDATPDPLDMGAATLAVIPFDGDDDSAFANALRSTLDLYFNVARPTADALIRSRDPVEPAGQPGSHAVRVGQRGRCPVQPAGPSRGGDQRLRGDCSRTPRS